MDMRRRLVVLTCVLACCLTARPAQAEEPDPLEHTPKLSVYSGFNFTSGSDDGAHVERMDAHIGAGYRFHPLLEASLSLHLGNTDFEYHTVTNQTTFDAELKQTRELWLNPGLRLQLMQTKKFSLQLFGDLEIPTEQNKAMDLKQVRITAPQMGQVDATMFFSEHVRTSYTWHSYSLGLTGRVRLGKFEPRFDLGVRRYQGSIDLDLDKQSHSILKLVGYADLLKTSYPVEYISPVAAIGADYRFGDHFAVSATGVAFPAPAGWFFGAGGSVRVMW